MGAGAVSFAAALAPERVSQVVLIGPFVRDIPVGGGKEMPMTCSQYLLSFVLPNLYFHHAMLHVALKQAGVRLGKADFDGIHEYPEGFSFG